MKTSEKALRLSQISCGFGRDRWRAVVRVSVYVGFICFYCPFPYDFCRFFFCLFLLFIFRLFIDSIVHFSIIFVDFSLFVALFFVCWSFSIYIYF